MEAAVLFMSYWGQNKPLYSLAFIEPLYHICHFLPTVNNLAIKLKRFVSNIIIELG